MQPMCVSFGCKFSGQFEQAKRFIVAKPNHLCAAPARTELDMTSLRHVSRWTVEPKYAIAALSADRIDIEGGKLLCRDAGNDFARRALYPTARTVHQGPR